jgi:hypothetical protein
MRILADIEAKVFLTYSLEISDVHNFSGLERQFRTGFAL